MAEQLPENDPNVPRPNDPFAQPAVEDPAAPPASGAPQQDPWIAKEQKEALTGFKSAAAAEEIGAELKMKNMIQPRQELMNELGTRAPAPKLEPYRDPPEVRANDAEEFKKYFMPMAVFAMLLGRVMRADAVDGLNMLSAGMKGYHEGRLGYANHMTQQWKQQMEKVQRENQRRLDEYQAVANDRNANIQEKQVRMNLIAAQNDDAIMMASLKKQNFQDVLKTLNTMAGQQDKFIKMQMLYEQNVFMRGIKLQMIDQQRLNRQERAREFDARLAAMAAKGEDKDFQKFSKAYNDHVSKILHDGTQGMVKIKTNPYQQLRPEWMEGSVNALANGLAGEMAYANAKARAAGFKLDERNEKLEAPDKMRSYLMLGPAAFGVDMGAGVLPPEGAAPAGPPQGAAPAPGAEGSFTPDQ